MPFSNAFLGLSASRKSDFNILGGVCLCDIKMGCKERNAQKKLVMLS
jgi:hypothetical protein